MRWATCLGRLTGAALALLCLAGPSSAQPAGNEAGPGQDKVLRVCQDPNNLPFSNRAEAGFDMAATTQPYYHSSYALVYVKGKGLDGVRGLDDLLALKPEQRGRLRFGVFTASPLSEWLVQNKLMEQVDWYQAMSGDAEQYPGQIVERDLASGKIDVAFVWGPIAGYFARTTRSAPIVAVPLASRPGMKLDFEIAMATRHGDKEFRQRIDQLIDANRGKIAAILDEYGVPQPDRQGRAAASQPAGTP
jgi:mxaJ protein